METKKSVYKAPGGKLLKVQLETDGKTIGAIRILGDFFAYPETCIEDLEKDLTGMGLMSREAIKAKIGEFVETNNVSLFGVDPESLTEAIMMCVLVVKKE